MMQAKSLVRGRVHLDLGIELLKTEAKSESWIPETIKQNQ